MPKKVKSAFKKLEAAGSCLPSKCNCQTIERVSIKTKQSSRKPIICPFEMLLFQFWSVVDRLFKTSKHYSKANNIRTRAYFLNIMRLNKIEIILLETFKENTFRV